MIRSRMVITSVVGWYLLMTAFRYITLNARFINCYSFISIHVSRNEKRSKICVSMKEEIESEVAARKYLGGRNSSSKSSLILVLVAVRLWLLPVTLIIIGFIPPS